MQIHEEQWLSKASTIYNQMKHTLPHGETFPFLLLSLFCIRKLLLECSNGKVLFSSHSSTFVTFSLMLRYRLYDMHPQDCGNRSNSTDSVPLAVLVTVHLMFAASTSHVTPEIRNYINLHITNETIQIN
jgi:hypothetical protein